MARLLVIEDDPNLACVVADQFMSEGHSVDIAGSGKQAERQWKANIYDLLILDWTLPDTNGIDLCKKFRTTSSTIPILMLTGHRDIEDKEIGFDAGADGNRPYLVMEYVKGESLADRMQRQGPLALSETLEILVQSCRGLEEIHKTGIVHRDLKPEIFCSRKGRNGRTG